MAVHTHGGGRPGDGATHTHTPGRAHTCWEAPRPRMHTLTHMPTNNTHTPPPPPAAQHPHWLARAARIWGMQPLGTLKHTRGLSHNTEARPYTRGICTSSLHTRAQRAPCNVPIRDRACFFRVQWPSLCPRTFHGCLVPTALSPKKINSSVTFSGSAACPTVPRATSSYSSSSYLRSSLASCSPQCIPC